MPDTVLPVVLAAGLGSRLGGVPKALLELEGETLLGRTAATLAGHGHERMVVVTGHGADQVEDWWRSAPRPLEARFLHNPRYAELNNFHTLALACEQLPAGRLLALNADIVFHSAVVADALAAGGQLTLAVEQGRVDAEALKVRIDDGHVRELGKHLDPRTAFGEFIGVSALDDAGRTAYAASAAEALQAGETTPYYEDIFSRICDEVDARVSAVAAGTWAEIDTPEDVPPAARVARSQSLEAPA
jgi:1L-myo-inositol 1-phosphate cytidylyltransferase / CDP-L-myo-inositol myo-inositolphosphotransferase